MTGNYSADVSNLTTEEQWRSLRDLSDTPVVGATARCYEQGSGGMVDPNCIATLQNARAAGITSLSVYHFPSHKRDPRSQTEASIANLATSDLTLDCYWLDVEPSTYDNWSSDTAANRSFISAWYQAAVDSLAAHPQLGCDTVGFYTRDSHWPAITGNWTEFGDTPLWFVWELSTAIAKRNGPKSFDKFSSHRFGGWQSATQVQWSLDVPFPNPSSGYDLSYSPTTNSTHTSVAAAPPTAPPTAPAPPPAPASADGHEAITYTVQPGDTFETLLTKFNVSREALAHANDIINPADVTPGRILQIPAR